MQEAQELARNTQAVAAAAVEQNTVAHPRKLPVACTPGAAVAAAVDRKDAACIAQAQVQRLSGSARRDGRIRRQEAFRLLSPGDCRGGWLDGCPEPDSFHCRHHRRSAFA